MGLVIVKNKKIMDALVIKEPDDIFYCEEEKEYYKWDEGWHSANEEVQLAGGLSMKTRELIANSIQEFEPYPNPVEKFEQAIMHWHGCTHSSYFLLYGKLISYFTFFVSSPFDSEEKFIDLLFECISNVGELIYVEDIEKGQPIIFWVKTPEGLITELYLMDYSAGVVHFNG